MAIITGTIIGTGQEIQIEIPTIRIPELPANILPFDNQDKLPLFDDSENKTVWTGIEDFRDYIITGGNSAGQTPVLQGDVLEIPITDEIVANTHVVDGEVRVRVEVPALQGQNYTLERRGFGTLKTSEFLNYPSGGFEIVYPNPNPESGETFVARIFELSVGQQTSGNGAYVFINGIAAIAETTLLNSTHFKKLIHVAGNANKVTITLPDITEAYEANLIIPVETNISNQNQTKIQGKDGQNIYFGNTSQTEVILGISEHIWLMAGSDGWYVMKASEGLLNVGQPLFDYTERLNTKTAVGQLVLKADIPRLMAWLASNHGLIVSETDWQNTKEDASLETGVNDWVYTLRGKFANYDAIDNTKVRLPDLQDLAFVGLKNIGGSDADRSINTAGAIQKDMIRKHDHDIDTELNGTDGTNNGTLIGDNIAENNSPGANTTVIKYTGGSKTTVKNVGLLPLIRI